MPKKPAHLLLLFLGFAAILLFIHSPFLRLPFYWDEVGQFVPAALDIYQHNQWIPQSTLPNIHPPGVMAYLALVWKIAGYSIPATKIAMLLMAAAGALFCFLLAIRLSRGTHGAPAFAAVAFLLATPMFYTQSMMTTLDMPAMVFTALALLLFLDDQILVCAVACTLLVLMKETAISTPFVFAIILMFRDKRIRESLYFLAPAAGLGLWLVALHHATGSWAGNPSFAKYNVSDSLTLGHIWGTLWRRGYFLFFADGLWIGAFVLFAGWRVFRSNQTQRDWNVSFIVAGAQLLVVSVFGGAALDRYTMPAYPVLYAAIAAAGSTFPVSWRWISRTAMVVALLTGLWWNPPYPFSFENNLAMVDFVELQRAAASYLDEHAGNARIASAWPLTDEMHRPELGFVHRPLNTEQIEDFRPSSFAALKNHDVQVLVVYCRVWGIDTIPMQWPWLREYLDRNWGVNRQASREQIRSMLGLVPIVRWDRRGQWIEIYVPETAVARMRDAH